MPVMSSRRTRARATVLGVVLLVVGLLTGAGAAQAQVPCANDSQCATITSGHSCQPVPGGTPGCGCVRNTDCDAPLVCDTSFGTPGFCNDRPCTSDTPCATSPYGHVCVNSTCGCTSDSDCPTGRMCDPNAGYCVENPCASDADCASYGFGLKCQMTADGEPYCGCATDADCLTGLRCDARGGDGAYNVCTAPCTGSDNCANLLRGPSCDTQSGLCGCSADADCSDPAQTCDTTKLCITPPCTSDADCQSSTAGYRCDTSAGTCGCVADSDCDSGYVCLTDSGTCGDPGCASDADCQGSADGQVCDTSTGACGCATDADCQPGQACNAALYFCEGTPTGTSDGGPADDGSTGGSDGPGVDAPAVIPDAGGPVDGGAGADRGQGADTGKGGGCSVAGGASDAPDLLSLVGILALLGIAVLAVRGARSPWRVLPQ
jgi:hypothetical protein